jgi:type VI secretion system protein ImpK
MSSTLTSPPDGSSAIPPHRGGLAQALQEAFTVTVRLRTGRQVANDADQFRTRMKALLASSDREARSAGYAADLVKRAIYAFVAFLDESVLNSPQAMFAHWARQPLQEEIFGDHMAGETFFRHLQDLLGRQDSEELADVLEVYHLCLLLGFRGRFGTTEHGELRALVTETGDKIRRIRAGAEPFAPSWALPSEVPSPPRDPWIRTFGMIAAGAVLLTIALAVVFTLILSGGVGAVESLAAST